MISKITMCWESFHVASLLQIQQTHKIKQCRVDNTSNNAQSFILQKLIILHFKLFWSSASCRDFSKHAYNTAVCFSSCSYENKTLIGLSHCLDKLLCTDGAFPSFYAVAKPFEPFSAKSWIGSKSCAFLKDFELTNCILLRNDNIDRDKHLSFMWICFGRMMVRFTKSSLQTFEPVSFYFPKILVAFMI